MLPPKILPRLRRTEQPVLASHHSRGVISWRRKQDCREQNICVRRRMCCGERRRMLAAQERRFRPSAVVRHPWQGVAPIHGQWGSSSPTKRTSLGAALLVPCRPRDRMGLRGASWEHARHQHQRNVHRSRRSALGGRWLHRAAHAPSPGKTQLFREARGARTWHGRVRGRFGDGKPEAFRGPAFVALEHRLLIPFYNERDDTLP
jgi:hypothetical protein